jgi:hypothetical protein
LLRSLACAAYRHESNATRLHEDSARGISPDDGTRVELR